jgi:hypothetical protein
MAKEEFFWFEEVSITFGRRIFSVIRFRLTGLVDVVELQGYRFSNFPN